MKPSEKKRIIRSEAAIAANQLLYELGDCGLINRCDIAGSLRRGAPTCGDIDIVAAASNLDNALHEIEAVVRGIGRIKLIADVPDVGYKLVMNPWREPQIKCEIWVVAPSHYGPTLNWATGSREHNRAIRLWCLARGFKLPIGSHRFQDSQGLWWLNREAFFCYVFRPEPASDRLETEEDFYNRLQLEWIPPGARQGGLKVVLQAHRRWLAQGGASRSRSSAHH